MVKKYTIGVDFGTLSARAVLCEVKTGIEVATSENKYAHGVMDKFLPDGKTALSTDWALQYPPDYLESLKYVIGDVLQKSKIDAADVIGIGTDFTECTMLPTKKDGTPLCVLKQFESEPHSYVKLWKHHAAQDEANKINEIAKKRNESFLARYGGKISSEWMFSKIWQILDEAPYIFDAADRFMELADWITMQLTGVEMRNCCTAGYKSMWNKREGYPSNDFFKALDPRLENVIDDKMSREIYPLGYRAGVISEQGAKLTGLKAGTSVAIGVGDAHIAVPAAGITKPGKMLMVMGTSGCDMMIGDSEQKVPGICGVVEDGIIPGYFGYEAGQCCLGDHYDWAVKNCASASYYEKASEQGQSIFAYIEKLASDLKPGQSGLLALDWWNGNRSVLVDADLTGLIIGLTLSTKPEEIYRALVEATAFGKRMIVETFKENNVAIDELYACGGIAEKSPFTMQIFADVCNMSIKIPKTQHTCAFGGAIWGAVAAGSANGGYDNIDDAVNHMCSSYDKVYLPIPEHVSVYNDIYNEYKILHDYFGRGENDVMKRLKKIMIKSNSK